MVTEIRTYRIKEGKLDAWSEQFKSRVRPLREKHGFHIEAAYAVPAASEFVWIVSYDGTESEFRAADEAYYKLPEHAPLHEEALGYLEGSSSVTVIPVF